MSKLKFAAVVLISLLAVTAAQAGSPCAQIVQGAVLTAGQWNNCFSQKQDDLGYTPINKAGDAMAGRLTTVAPSTLAGFNLTPGSDPISPVNGDVWVKSSGMYVRINGATVGPLLGAAATTGTSILLGNGSGGFANYAGTTATSHQWITALSATGAATKAQPACADISDAAASCNTNATNATNITSGTLAAARLGGMSVITNSIAGNVSLSSTGSYFDGPSLAQGTSGTWLAMGTVTLNSSTADSIVCKLWDGTSTIANGVFQVSAGGTGSLSLSGTIGTPAANIRISCRDTSTTNGLIVSTSDSTAKSSTLTAIRIN
jgi:hypothetical protein